jgi:hypothetical protein
MMMLVVMWMAMFSMGAAMGGQAAVNESVSPETVHENVTDARHEVNKNLTAELSSLEEPVVMSIVKPAMAVGFPVTHVGVDIGVRYPEWVPVINYSTPIVSVGLMSVVLYRRIKRLGVLH